MNIEILRILVDFGLLVLILLVQLIIYPSFIKMPAADLKLWHPTYTRRITIVVLPLMIGQAILIGKQFVSAFTYTNVASLLALISLWALTFLQAVPLHNKIDKSSKPLEAAKQLVKANRIRVFLWAFLFIFNVMEYFLEHGTEI